MKQFWTTGKCDALVCIIVTGFATDFLIASAETEHLTENQFYKAIEKVYGTTYDIHIEHQRWPSDYWRADMRLKE